MNRSIRNVIRRHQGYLYETAGIISVFFFGPQEAMECADELFALVDNMQVFGRQLTFTASVFRVPVQGPRATGTARRTPACFHRKGDVS
jgi:hypothetical protein